MYLPVVMDASVIILVSSKPDWIFSDSKNASGLRSLILALIVTLKDLLSSEVAGVVIKLTFS